MRDADTSSVDECVPRVVLVGPPGAGKTSVGTRLAELLGVEFRDTDEDIEARAGKPVAEIFVTDGEPAFRAMERAAVAEALRTHDGVLALGGGAVVDEQTRELLLGHTVVFLDVSVGAAAGRVGLDAPRPLLVVNPRSTLRRLMEERRSYYEYAATAVVATSDLGVEDVVAAVLDVIGQPAPRR